MTIARQGLVHGTAGSGGIGLSLSSSTYRETGTQNVAGGVAAQLMLRPDSQDTLSTVGIGGRYAHQLGAARDWRGFTRGSFGVAHCQLATCTDPMDAMAHRYAFEAQLGIERLLMAPGAEQPQDGPFISTELAVVYTHVHDRLLGDGDFVGLALGLRIGLNLFAPKPVTGAGR
ncbi:MAG TPA: hypothetical protein VIV40_40120 [Kofleriaceae bacterium]